MLIMQEQAGISNKKSGPSKMAETVALIRALESEKPEDERICYDPYAIRFVSSDTREFMAREPEKFRAEYDSIERGLPGYSNSVVARVRYFDDAVKASVEDGIEQLVILGAGYDTRAYRIEGLTKVKVFEVDQPGTIDVKAGKIKEIFGLIPGHVTYVPLDLGADSLEKKLAESGYEPSKKTLFAMEGLIYYLTPATVDGLLSFAVHHSGRGSAVVLDYGKVRPNAAGGSAGTTGYNYAKQRGEPVKSYIEGSIEAFLSARGFSCIEKMESADYKKAYFHGKNAGRKVSDLAAFACAAVDYSNKRAAER
jgi:methyltransferase (TIGR00027 family)